jgi:hypothetical protein
MEESLGYWVLRNVDRLRAFIFLFSGFASCCAQYNNTQQSTTFHNQTPECSFTFLLLLYRTTYTI